MIITAIKIRKVENSGTRMIGVCSLTLNNMIAIHDIKIILSESGMFLAMPSRKTNTNTFKDIVHPINASVREAIEKLVFAAYEKCAEENVSSAYFEIKTDFTGILTEQTFDNFILSSTIDYSNNGSNAFASTGGAALPKNTSDDSIGNALSKWLEG